MKKNNVAWCGVIAITGIVFYLFNSVVPYYSDDWWYSFIHQSDGSYPTHRITSPGDIITSQINHYQTVNGRLPVTAVVQAIVSFCPKAMFDLLNTVIFLLATTLLTRYAFPHTHRTPSMWLVSATSLFLLLPGHYETMMWATGSINYLWVAVWILATLLLWQKVTTSAVTAHLYLPIFLVGLLAGWSNEALSFGLVAGMVAELFLRRKEQLPTAAYLLVAGVVTGVCMILFSPGAWSRAEGISFLPSYTLYLPIIGGIFLPFLMLISGIYKQRRGCLHIRQYRTVVIASVVLIPVCLATYQYTNRSFFGTALFALIPLLNMWSEQIAKLLQPYKTKFTFAILLCCITGILLVEHNKVEKRHRFLIENYKDSPLGIVAVDTYTPCFPISLYTLDLNDEYLNGYTATHMAAYYGKPRLQWLSTELYHSLIHPDEFFTTANRIDGTAGLYTTPTLSAYVCHPDSILPDTLYYSFADESVSDAVPLLSKTRRLLNPQPAHSELCPTYRKVYHLPGGSYMYCDKNQYYVVTRIDHP